MLTYMTIELSKAYCISVTSTLQQQNYRLLTRFLFSACHSWPAATLRVRI